MAISNVIDTADPDGATKKVSYLDNAIRTVKIDVQERMEDSIIDTGVTGWTTTTSKELKEGLARVATDTRANKATFTTIFSPQVLKDGKIFVATDADNTNAFEYYSGAAWTAIPVGTANLLSDAVTTAKILDANVTTAKIAANAVVALRADLTNVTDDQVAAAYAVIGLFSGDDFTISFTPNSANSIIVCVLQCRPSLSAGAASEAGSLAIIETVAPTTLIEMTTNRQDKILDGDANARNPMTVIGVQTGVTGARTYTAQMRAVATGGQVIHLNGDEATARFMVFEFLSR